MEVKSSPNLRMSKPGEGTKLSVLGHTLIWKATVESTGKNSELFEITGIEKSGPPLHNHPWDEAYYILEGEVEVQVGEEVMTSTPGCFITIPSETPHTYNIKSDRAKFLVLVSSPAARQFFQEIDSEVKSLPPDMEKVINIGKKHKVTIAHPE